jgi:hypothetical protein
LAVVGLLPLEPTQIVVVLALHLVQLPLLVVGVVVKPLILQLQVLAQMEVLEVVVRTMHSQAAREIHHQLLQRKVQMEGQPQT